MVSRHGTAGIEQAARGGQPGQPARISRIGRAGLAACGLSVALTFTVAVLGPSLMEPPLPGRAGQPPWSVSAHPSPYLVVALTAAALLAGTAGLALALWAGRHGWGIRPGLLLAAGIVAAVALALVPPFGSSDHLSYAAYGRMAVTAHNPYATTPAQLARLGDPVGAAVEDWRSSPSVYGSLATAGQAVASDIGGTSVRLTVFVLSLLNVAAFVLTGLLLRWLARGDRRRQLRAALLWTANPLLLQVLVAGAHVDCQAIMFGVAAVAAFSVAVSQISLPRRLLWTAAAGGLAGLGFAVKATMALVGLGLAIACLLAAREARSRDAESGERTGRAVATVAALAAGFAVTAGLSLAGWGISSLRPALRAGSYVSVGSPWRPVRSLLALGLSDAAAEDIVKIGAVLLAAALLLLMLCAIMAARRDGQLLPGPVPEGAGWPGAAAGLFPGVVVAVTLAWLFAWPYVLPWYDGLGWAVLALLPWSGLDWLLLARTAALGIGYLPARGTVTMPAGLGWLEPVIRTAITPAILLGCLIALIAMAWPGRTRHWPAGDG
jgi:hypothetical protein